MLQTRSSCTEMVKAEKKGKKMIIKGYGSVFGVLDSHGHMVKKGAYKKTIKDDMKRIKFLYGHEGEPIGIYKVLKEDEHGLYFEVELLQTKKGEDVTVMYEKGAIFEHSIGGYSLEKNIEWIENDEFESGGYYLLKEIVLKEISAVKWASNKEAVLTGLEKSAETKKIVEVAENLLKSLEVTDENSILRTKYNKSMLSQLIKEVKGIAAIEKVDQKTEETKEQQKTQPVKRTVEDDLNDLFIL